MTRRRRTPAEPDGVAGDCAPYLPELQRIVLRCVGDDAAAAAVLTEAVARAARAGQLPAGPELRRALFSLVHDVLLERTREVRARGPHPPPSPVGTSPG